jgi:hypothetical protein
LQSESFPNPLKSRFPNNITGTINSTIFVVPIPYVQVDAVISSRWPILRHAIQELYPGFPADKYPVNYPTLHHSLPLIDTSKLIIQAGIEHDIWGNGKSVEPDSQVRKYFSAFSTPQIG